MKQDNILVDRYVIHPPLTAPQMKCLQAIWWYRGKYGISPSLAELQHLLGVNNPGRVAGILDGLETKGYIHRQRYRRRSIVPLISVEDATDYARRVEEAKTAVLPDKDRFC